MLNLLRTQFPGLKVTVHGFRSTFKTWAEESRNFKENAIEFCLAHQLSNKVEKAYLRSDLFTQRKVIMKAWEQFVIHGS